MTTTGKTYGTYRNQYGKLVNDHGPSEGQVDFLIKLVNEKIVPNDYIARLIEDFNADDLSGQNAKILIDALINAKSKIVLPSTLPLDGERKPASDKQLYWINKMLVEKNIPEDEAELILGWVADGFPGRNAGRVMDYLFDAPQAGFVPTKGFVGEIGEKVTVTGTVTTFKKIETSYGETNLIVITTEDGQAVKTFSKAKSFWGLSEGSKVTVTGTVKGYDSFKGSEATMISRPSIIG